jgi:hypothetical protein
MNGIAQATAEALAQNATGRADAILIGTLGVDIAQLRMRREAAPSGAAPIAIHWFADRWTPSLKWQLARKPDALLVAQGDRDPQFFADAAVRGDCYEKKVVRVGGYASTAFVPTGRCTFAITTP